MRPLLTGLRLKRMLHNAIRVGRSQEPTLERQDHRREYGEVRMRAISRVGADILFVVYTDRGDARHILSARLANRKERKLWQSFADQWKLSTE